MNKANPQQSTCDSPEEEWGLPIAAQPQPPPPQPSSLNGRGGGGGGGGGSRKKRKTSTSNGPGSSNKSTSPSSSSTSSSPPSTSSASKKRRRTDCAAIWRAEAASPLRTGRNPARGVEPSKNTQKLVELILASDSSVEVLRLSERMDKTETKETLMEAFSMLDMDQGGSISREELKRVMQNFSKAGEQIDDEEIDRMITECDVDGDGEISVDEFCDVMMRNE